MDISVLGPLTAEIDGRSILPTAGKPRQLLALLAVHADRVLPVPMLMEELWGADLPRSALTTLQSYVLQLRRRLAAAGDPDRPVDPKDLLVTRYGGYLLRTPPESVDAHRYEQLVAAGQRAADEREDERAVGLLRAALGLWRGPALVDVRIGPILEIETVRMEESRLAVLEQCIAAELRLGQHNRLLAELSALTARHPLHEGLHAQWMVALYRAGRSWRALDVFQELRGRLVEDLGLEPSPRLQRLHQAVLAANPDLDLVVDDRPPAIDMFAA